MAGKFIPNPAGIAQLLQSPTGDIGIFFALLTEEVESLAESYCPEDTGDLSTSISGSVITPPLRGEVKAGGDSAPYVMSVHEGTQPHEITPKTAQYLQFPNQAGEMVYAKRVFHPGTKANPFLWEALRDVIMTYAR
jgi:hypothetical protein